MKILRLFSLVGITSIALAQVVWAGPHGGGGGGGFAGGGSARGGGGGFRSAGFGGGQFGGARFGAPHMVSGGAINRGGGVGFGMPRRANEFSSIPNGVTRVQPSVPSRSQVVRSPVTNPTGSLTNAGRVNRTRNTSGGATAGLDRTRNRGGSVPAGNGQVSRPTTPRPSNEAALSRQHHIFARESSAQHRDWDRRHAHFSNGHWFCWDGAFWIGLDDGYYPWDFYPYYAYDYYPYDYYADVEPGYQNYTAQQADQTVSAVQSDLAQLGYYSGSIDGVFGADTRTALTRYQIDRGLQVTGSLTNETLQSLGLPALASN